MTTIVNLFGGPGSGKSTAAHGLMFLLKSKGIEAEFAHEWIKHPVWQGREDFPQYYVWAKQQKLIDGLVGKVDVIVTDSPTLLSLSYGDEPAEFKLLVIQKFREQNAINIYVDRVKAYWAKGRYQTYEESRELDTTIDGTLHYHSIEHEHFPGDEELPGILASRLIP